MFPSICQCGSQSGYPHTEDCPYPYFFGDDKGVAKWNAAHETKVFIMKYGFDPETVRFARENEIWDLVDEQGSPVELPAVPSDSKESQLTQRALDGAARCPNCSKPWDKFFCAECGYCKPPRQ